MSHSTFHSTLWPGAVLLLCLPLLACEEDRVLGPPNQGVPEPSAQVKGDGGATAGDAGMRPCDLGGAWAIHRVTFTTPATALASGSQKSSTWYYYEIEQTGDDFEVTAGFVCDVFTTGDANVGVLDEGKAESRKKNPPVGRRGTYIPDGDGCQLEIDRLYILLGLGPLETYLPGVTGDLAVVDSEPAIEDLPPLPDASSPDAQDWDMDGLPGIQYIISDSPLGSGTRHSTQRTWEDMSGPTESFATEFTVPVDWDFDEVIHQASNAFFMTGAVPRAEAPHQARWLRLESDFVGANADGTCDKVVEAMPHRREPLEDY